MDLRHLTTFQSVVKHDSFVRAAEELQYAQSTVTLHIQQLENELGVKLFARRGKKVRLNEAGRALMAQAEQILLQIDTLKQNMLDLGQGEAGYVRIGAIEPAAGHRLPPLLVRFCDERPKVRLTLEVGGTNAISSRVASGDLDFGICSPPSAGLGLVYEPLFKEVLGLLVPKGHRLASKDTVSVADLNGSRLLLTEPGCAYRALTERVLQECWANPYGGIEIGSYGAIAQAVRHDLGIAIVPTAGVNPPPPGTVLRQLEGVELSLSVGLARRADNLGQGRAAAELMEAVRAGLRAGPGRTASIVAA
jgi:DNA-binding transcriptional LysR family regulator